MAHDPARKPGRPRTAPAQDATPEDAVHGYWLREDLIKMDLRFRERMSAALLGGSSAGESIPEPAPAPAPSPKPKPRVDNIRVTPPRVERDHEIMRTLAMELRARFG